MEPFRDEVVGLLMKIEDLEREVLRLREELARAGELVPLNGDAVARRISEDNEELRRENQRLRAECEEVRMLRRELQRRAPVKDVWEALASFFRRE